MGRYDALGLLALLLVRWVDAPVAAGPSGTSASPGPVVTVLSGPPPVAPISAAAPSPGVLELAAGGTPAVAELAVVTGTVRDEDGRPSAGAMALVETLGGDLVAGAVGEDGRFRIAVPPGPVRVLARRLDGQVEAESVAVRGVLATDEVLAVDLELPVDFAGETGVLAVMESRGFRVAAVMPGSPAEARGLREGDRIVSVDGRPAESLSERELDLAMRGSEGTAVVLGVEASDDQGAFELELSVERQAVEVIDTGWGG
ncbi:MAG: PDZ domain-containing protein [Alphaproteobacteria bacterium]|nr:PDZ domain-containing protein [Alphaproteobacteria bacterium]MCB9690805.1 PDZ domain-containing protein [Alphaproteobacteria bacterium]